MADIKELVEKNAGPPVNIEAIIRGLGIDLDKKADLDPEIAGQIEVLRNGRFKISANKQGGYFRQRFTMAHELGHFIYHAHLIADGVDDTRAYRSTDKGRFYNQKIGAAEETQANRFAASVLMPASKVKEWWPQLQDISEMAKKFLVSQQAMEIRLKGLGLIS